MNLKELHDAKAFFPISFNCAEKVIRRIDELSNAFDAILVIFAGILYSLMSRHAKTKTSKSSLFSSF